MNKTHYRIGSRKGLSARCLVLLSLLIIGIFAGCAGKDSGIEAGKDKGVFSWFRSAAGPPEPESEVDLSDKARDNFINGRHILAEGNFQKAQDRYPFSQ